MFESSQENTNLSSGKSELQMVFSYFRPPCLCPSEGHKHGVSRTNLYKFVWNIMSNNSRTEYGTDLRLGQSPYLFIVSNVQIS